MKIQQIVEKNVPLEFKNKKLFSRSKDQNFSKGREIFEGKKMIAPRSEQLEGMCLELKYCM